MYKVLITHSLPYKGVELLYENFHVIIPECSMIDGVLLDEHLKDCDALLCTYAFKVTKRVIDKAHNLKIIANFGIGCDNIDVDYAKSKGICVTNSPGMAAEYTAELTLALMLNVMRKVKENDLKIRGCSGRNVIDVMSNLGNTLYGKTLGLIGMGNIAQAVARRAKVFGLKIIYYSRHRVDLSVESNLSLEWRESMSDLLRDADIISLHIPAVSKNKLMSEQEFKLMKPNSVLINTARGALVDEGALIKALKEHWIYGAALDVFENEDEINPQLLMLDNVLLSPHNGTGTIEARVQSAMKASLNIYNYFYLDKKDLNAV